VECSGGTTARGTDFALQQSDHLIPPATLLRPDKVVGGEQAQERQTNTISDHVARKYS